MATYIPGHIKRLRKRIAPEPYKNGGSRNRDIRKRGHEIQTYGLDCNGGLVHAGPHYVARFDSRTMYDLHRRWLRWRKWYDSKRENRSRDYPAKHSLPVKWFGAELAGPYRNGRIHWLKVS